MSKDFIYIYIIYMICVYIYYIYVYNFCTLPGTGWPKTKHSRVPNKFVLDHVSLGPDVIYEAFPKDLGMGVGVDRRVMQSIIGTRGRNIMSAQ
jgi:hypothetical protein